MHEKLVILQQELGYSWASPEDLPELMSYAEFFGYDPSRFSARFMTVDEGDVFIAHVRSTRETPVGILVLVHGYMAHTGHLSDLAELFAQDGYDVYLIDLPGNGLSYGPRNDIEDFSVYGQALAELWSIIDTPQATPCILLGHSTGASAILEFLQMRTELDGPDPAGLIFASPLIDLADAKFRITMNSLVGKQPFKIPAIFRTPELMSKGVSRTPEFRKFSTIGDPLFSPLYAPTWLDAYERWIEGWDELPEHLYDGPLLVVQGTGDNVVDWRRGIPRLEEKFPQVEVHYYEKEAHAILNLDEDALATLYADMQEFIERM